MSAEIKRAIVNQVVQTLQTGLYGSTGIEVMEVFEGGSMGQGTVLPGKSDIDLVLYTRSISPEDLMDETKREETLSKIEGFLQRALPPNNFTAHEPTPHALQFQMSRGSAIVEIDLLPSFLWESPKHLADYLFSKCPEEDRYCLSSGAAKWQTEFIQRQPPRVKEFIRRTKRWKKENKDDWKGKEGRPSSYLLSLLVVAAYRVVPEDWKPLTSKELAQWKKKEIGEMVTIEIKRLVHSHRAMDVYWDDHLYGRERNLPSRPRIIDPANPANNLYSSGFGHKPNQDDPDKDWRILASRIDSLDLLIPLQSPLHI